MNILFLCTGNSCRSQMAEGFGKSLLGHKYNFYSAGTKKHGLNPYAVKVMAEVDIDISIHESNSIDELEGITMDVVFTVCSDAHENCPYFPGGKIIHRGFDDPPRMSANIESEEETLQIYRRVRDEIKDFIQNMAQEIEEVAQ